MAVQPLASQVGVAPACRALGVPRASFYRRQQARSRASAAPSYARPGPACVRTRARPRRARQPALRRPVTGRGRRTLLDEGRYLCAERTMYRILAANQPVRERRNHAVIPATPSPSWWPRAPTRPGPSPGSGGPNAGRPSTSMSCGHLQPLRRWMVADRENAALAATLIEETCLKQGIGAPGAHPAFGPRRADDQQVHRPTPRRPRGHTRSLSRPQVSDDNPFSEAQFKTLKYHPGFPGRFEDITAAIAFCRSFFPWYNTEHRHAGIAMLTPDDVHHHRAPDVLAQRGRTLQAAWALHPERFVHGTPKPAPLPEAVWINPPATSTTGETSQ